MDFFKELIRAARRKPEINQDSNIPTPEIKEYVVSILDEVNEDVELVNRTVNAGTYFYSLNKLIDELRELSQYEKYRFFKNSTPSEDCRKILKPENLQHNADMLITRALRYCMSELRFLTVETKRDEAYKRYISNIRDAFEQSHTFWIGKDYPHYTGALFTQANMDRVRQLCNEQESGYRLVMERIGDDWEPPSDFQDKIPQRLHDGQYILVDKPPSTAETIAYRKKAEDWLESYYDLNTAEGIQAIPEIKHPPKCPDCDLYDVTSDIDYYLQFKSVEHEKAGNIELAILCLRKSNAIRALGDSLYRKSDYYRLVRLLEKYGFSDEARIEAARIDDFFSDYYERKNREAQDKALAMADDDFFDAVELTAHLSPSPEHEYIQGRVFLREQFDRMQSGKDFWDVDGNHYEAISRAIGEDGCGHFAIPVNHSASRVYSDEQLAEFIRKNHEGCVIDGKHYTIYEAEQLMRKLEADSRELKTQAITAQNNGDIDERCRYQEKINEVSRKYSEVAAIAGLRERNTNMYVKGFRPVSLTVEKDRKANAPDYRWIKENLPTMCPKSLDGYRRMKNQNTKNYRKIVEAARAMGYEIV